LRKQFLTLSYPAVSAAGFFNKSLLILFFLLSVLFVLGTDASAKSLRAEISPRKIKPGDVFFIRVKNAKSSEVPVASLAGGEFSFSACGEGCFIAIGAADIKATPGPHIVKMKVGSERRNLRISVKRVRFPMVKLTLPEDKVILSPGDLERARNEEKKLEGIFQTISGKLWNGAFVMPLENELSTTFGTERIMNEKLVSVHKGIDIRGKEGEDVKASNDGRVAVAEGLFFGGNTVVIDHGQGVFTVYMHLSKMKVSPGDLVSKGEIIGFVGSSGRATGPHLHFGAKVAYIPVNPVSLIELRL
jgi:murein DD-endopeptidase MepM/ murein hydrolase activator NlpD